MSEGAVSGVSPLVTSTPVSPRLANERDHPGGSRVVRWGATDGRARFPEVECFACEDDFPPDPEDRLPAHSVEPSRHARHGDVRFRRIVALVLMSAVVPGLGHLLGGHRRAGVAIM